MGEEGKERGAKSEGFSNRELTMEQVKEEEAKKAKAREKQKMSQFASNNPLPAKQLK